MTSQQVSKVYQCSKLPAQGIETCERVLFCERLRGARPQRLRLCTGINKNCDSDFATRVKPASVVILMYVAAVICGNSEVARKHTFILNNKKTRNSTSGPLAIDI